MSGLEPVSLADSGLDVTHYLFAIIVSYLIDRCGRPNHMQLSG